MTDQASGMQTAAQRAINPEYRTNMEIVSRRGGIFWGAVLLIVGGVWLMGSLGYVDLNANLVVPMLVMLGGIYLLMSKLVR